MKLARDKFFFYYQD